MLDKPKILKLLDLQPFDEFALAQYRRMTDAEFVKRAGLERTVLMLRGGYGTGRTTEMLVNALVLAEEGSRVHVAGHTFNRTRELHFQLQQMAIRCGCSDETQALLVGVGDYNRWLNNAGGDRTAIFLFTDHYTPAGQLETTRRHLTRP